MCVSVCSCLSFLCQAPVTHSDFTLQWISRFDSNPIYLSSCFFFSPGLLSYLTITVHVIVHYAVLSLQLQHAAAQSGVSSRLMLLSLDVFLPAPLHRTILDIVSVRVDRVVDQKPVTERSLDQVVISSSSSFTFIGLHHKHAFKGFTEATTI